ncbi:MAG: putative movement protein (6 kDa) [Plant associated closterovirus 1]|nr:MAG: putative movement protein (6 kDa) [Plant associated closterovirus 1]
MDCVLKSYLLIGFGVVLALLLVFLYFILILVHRHLFKNRPSALVYRDGNSAAVV